MEEQPENSPITGNIEEPEFEQGHRGNQAALILPFLMSVFLFLGFTSLDSASEYLKQNQVYSVDNSKTPDINFTALLAGEQFSKNLRDTVYTNDDKWLELRIDKQTLYVHYKNGNVKTLPVSTGNKFLSKGIESRPGLFAIFLKEEVHLSSQFDNARMNYYMPYNMGIGFHGLPGTGYYGFLGVRPSSHGCIRMRNEDVKGLFNECKIGTIVLAHTGHSARVVAFAPEDFKNDVVFTKDDYLNMLAYNLGSIMEGKYFVNPPKRFIIDGTIIPRSGVNVRSIEEIPEKQRMPYKPTFFTVQLDKLGCAGYKFAIKDSVELPFAESFDRNSEDSLSNTNTGLPVSPEMVKKYVYNPVGVLPYFPPNR